jgi:chemotaxis signal transduction protein
MLGARDTIDAAEPRYVVVVGGGRKLGLLVDGACEVVYVPCECIEPYTAAAASETPYVAAVVPGQSPPLMLIDLDELLNQFPYENGVGPKRIRTDQQE